MKQQESDFQYEKKQDAFERLLYELYTFGPIRLVDDNGHPDLVSDNSRLCCKHEPFLEIVELMQENRLVESLEVKRERILILTDKGHLTGMLFAQRSRIDKNCNCQRCCAAFDEFLRLLLQCRKVQLVLNEEGHPHIIADEKNLCCRNKPFLYVLCKLEQQRLVEISEDFLCSITDRGRKLAHMILLPNSAVFAESARLN